MLVQGDFIDRPSDSARGDKDYPGTEQFCHAGVGEIKHRADAGMARTFDQREILSQETRSKARQILSSSAASIGPGSAGSGA